MLVLRLQVNGLAVIFLQSLPSRDLIADSIETVRLLRRDYLIIRLLTRYLGYDGLYDETFSRHMLTKAIRCRLSTMMAISLYPAATRIVSISVSFNGGH